MNLLKRSAPAGESLALTLEEAQARAAAQRAAAERLLDEARLLEERIKSEAVQARAYEIVRELQAAEAVAHDRERRARARLETARDVLARAQQELIEAERDHADSLRVRERVQADLAAHPPLNVPASDEGTALATLDELSSLETRLELTREAAQRVAERRASDAARNGRATAVR
jgi:hypothetical protein